MEEKGPQGQSDKEEQTGKDGSSNSFAMLVYAIAVFIVLGIGLVTILLRVKS